MSRPRRVSRSVMVGELWFDSDEAMQQALNSLEMGAAVEDAKRFLDMEKTGLIMVEEKPVVGLANPII